MADPVSIQQLFRGDLHPALWQVPEPPESLFVQGTSRAMGLLSSLPDRGLAIVGTRDPHWRVQRLLKLALQSLGGEELIIVSGFARGVDAIAHAGALDVGLPTIAILGTPLDVDYPSGHGELRRKILQSDGLVVSEFAPGTEMFKANFPQRNRLIAGWSRATWVAQAPSGSGALSTARWARGMDRLCFAVPAFPGEHRFEGNQQLLDALNASPFWGAHSLGEVWLELAARSSRRGKRSRTFAGGQTPCISPERELADEVERLALARGSCEIQDLLAWATERGKSPAEFFESFERALRDGLVVDERGLLLKNPSL